MKKKSKEKQQATSAKQKAKEDPKTSEPENKPFDFGGLPNRDLKKNLGCG